MKFLSNEEALAIVCAMIKKGSIPCPLIKTPAESENISNLEQKELEKFGKKILKIVSALRGQQNEEK